MTQNDIQLAKLKINKALSEETTCFSAELQLRGKTVAHVGNRGNGGCNHYHWTNPEAQTEIQAWIKEQTYTYEMQGKQYTVEIEKLDWCLSLMLEQEQAKKQISRWCKKGIVFRLKSDKSGEWRTIPHPYAEQAKDWLAKKYGDAVECIANENIDAALKFA